LGPVLAETLRDIGVNVSMPGMDWSTVVSNFADKANNTWNAYTSWHTFSFLKTPLTNFLIRQGGAERYENEKIVDLQAQYTRAADEAERARLRDDIQLVFYEDKPVLLFGTFFSIIPYSERLKNLSVGVFPVFSNVYLEK
jgi:ABC-type transport system substrate-binding protein